jgi:hypothetical protein
MATCKSNNARVMKTTKILISSALLALATTTFGQLGAIKERLRAEKAEQVQYHQVGFTIHSNHGQKFPGLESLLNRVDADIYDSPVVEQTIFASQAEVTYTYEIGLESWMSTPFEADFAGEGLFLESWMAVPFEIEVDEEELYMESWMTEPFDTEVAEEELSLESWMFTPFYYDMADDELQQKDWITAANWK